MKDMNMEKGGHSFDKLCDMSMKHMKEGNSSDYMKLGGGGRFKKLTKKLEFKGASNPKALAAYIGRKKYGKVKFQKLAAKGH